jgi:hypothetical protein
MAVRKKSRKLIEDQLQQQELVLSENRVKVEEPKLQAGQNARTGETASKAGINVWAANTFQAPELPAKPGIEAVGNTTLNDNVAVDTAFLEGGVKTRSGPQEPGAEDKSMAKGQVQLGRASIANSLVLSGESAPVPQQITAAAQMQVPLTGMATVSGSLTMPLPSPSVSGDPFSAPAPSAPAAISPPSDPFAMPGRAAPTVEDPFPLPQVAATTVKQLRPAGRLSLPVDVPLSGTVYHFRKLKDHARLEVAVSRPWEPERKAAMGWLGAGMLVLGIMEWLRRRRQARRGW